MNISKEKMAVYKESFHKKCLLKQLKCEKRRKHALELAKKASNMLKYTYGADEVLLFGSLSRGGIFDEHSDVDLAVKGLDEKKYYRILAELLNLDPEIDIDLVMVEDASKSLLAAIKNEGKSI